MIPRALLFALLIPIASAAAQASSIACSPTASIRWEEAVPAVHPYDDPVFGPTLFELDLGTGRYDEHLVGGRAGVSGGGTLDIVLPGTTDRQPDLVGVDREDGSVFRIALGVNPIAFFRTHASGEIDIGTCIAGDLIDVVEAHP